MATMTRKNLSAKETEITKTSVVAKEEIQQTTKKLRKLNLIMKEVSNKSLSIRWRKSNIRSLNNNNSTMVQWKYIRREEAAIKKSNNQLKKVL
jgi:hypothetical protein